MLTGYLRHTNATVTYIYLLKILFNINNINDNSVGVVRQMRTRLTMAIICWIYAAQSYRHSTGAASR